MIPKEKKLRLQAKADSLREAWQIPKQAFIGQKVISGINQPDNVIKIDTGLCSHLLVRTKDAVENYPIYPATFGMAQLTLYGSTNPYQKAQLWLTTCLH